MRKRYAFWTPHTLGYKFFAEARRLFEVQIYKEPHITSIQAALVMSVTYNLYAMDKIGISYTVQAVEMARNLNLFDAPAGLQGNTRTLLGHQFTAWAVYFWIR